MEPITINRFYYISGDEDAFSAQVKELKIAAGIEIGSGDRLYLADVARGGVIHVCGQGARLPKYLKHWTLVFHADEEEATLNAEYFYKITVSSKGQWEMEYAAEFKKTPVETLWTVKTFAQKCLDKAGMEQGVGGAHSPPKREELVQLAIRLPPPPLLLPVDKENKNVEKENKKLMQAVAWLAIQLTENGERTLAKQLLAYAELQGVLVPKTRPHTIVTSTVLVTDLLVELVAGRISEESAYNRWKQAYDEGIIEKGREKNFELLTTLTPSKEVQESLRTEFVACQHKDRILLKMIEVSMKLLVLKELDDAREFFFLIFPHMKEGSYQGAIEAWVALYRGKLEKVFAPLALPKILSLMEKFMKDEPTMCAHLVAQYALEYLKRGDCNQIPRVWNLFFTALARLERVEPPFTEAFVRYLKEHSACDELKGLALPLPALLDQITRDEKYTDARELLADRLEVAGMLKSEPCYRKFLVQAMREKMRSPQLALRFLESISSLLLDEELSSCRIMVLGKLPERERGKALLSFLERSPPAWAQRAEVQALLRSLADNPDLAPYLPDDVKRVRILEQISLCERQGRWRECGQHLLTLHEYQGKVSHICANIFSSPGASHHTKKANAALVVALVEKFPRDYSGKWVEELCEYLIREKNYPLFNTLFGCLPHPISPKLWLLQLERLRDPRSTPEAKKSFLENAPAFTLEELGEASLVKAYMLLIEEEVVRMTKQGYPPPRRYVHLLSEGQGDRAWDDRAWDDRIECLRTLSLLLSPETRSAAAIWLGNINFSITPFEQGIKLLAALTVLVIPCLTKDEATAEEMWKKWEEGIQCYGIKYHAHIAKALHDLLIEFPTQQKLVRRFISLNKTIAVEERERYLTSIYFLSIHARLPLFEIARLSIPTAGMMTNYHGKMPLWMRGDFLKKLRAQLDDLCGEDYKGPLGAFPTLRLLMGYVTLAKACTLPKEMLIDEIHICGLGERLDECMLLLEGGQSQEREVVAEAILYVKNLVSYMISLKKMSKGLYVDKVCRLFALQKRLSPETSLQSNSNLANAIKEYTDSYCPMPEEIVPYLCTWYLNELSRVMDGLKKKKVMEVLPACGRFLGLSLILPEYLDLFGRVPYVGISSISSIQNMYRIEMENLQRDWNRVAREIEVYLNSAVWPESASPEYGYCKQIVDKMLSCIKEM